MSHVKETVSIIFTVFW